MTSSTSNSGSASIDLTSIYQNVQNQRAQLAQYSILQASSFMSAGKNDQAIGAFKKAAALDPQNSTAYNYMGQIYMTQGNNTEAIKAFQQLVRVQSNPATADTSTNAPSLAEAHVSLGNAYLQDKQYVQSETEYKTAARLDPQNPIADYTLGHQYLTQNRISDAEVQFKKVQKISPQDGNIYYALGQVYNKQGKFDEAAKNLEKSQQLKPNFSAANYELGIAYNGQGNSDAAQNQLKILQSSDPTLAVQLDVDINKPQIVAIDRSNIRNNFLDNLGPGTPLWMLDPTLLTAPNSSRTFAVTIQFNTKMDVSSVTNPQNWTISRANTSDAGYYNNTMPLSTQEASFMPNPVSVTYDSINHEATVNFLISQNSNADATIDPSHLVFTFNGKDDLGRVMDTTANAIDGYALTPF